jgi:spore germination cell wall hydrolase CwlJ-like protein
LILRLRHLAQAFWDNLPRRDAMHMVAAELCLLALLTGGVALASVPAKPSARIAKLTAGEMSPEAFARLTAGMDPAMLTLASRMTPELQSAFQKASTNAEVPAQASEPAVMRLQDLDPDAARAWNLANPTYRGPNPPAKPFHLTAGGLLAESRAVDCMTAAIYYEAAWESPEGQKAVAQVVLNRLRHPAYPKTVCGVVFQGSNRTTGCQFSFTCDGAMKRTPQPETWDRARTIAQAALNGYVMKAVGNATHYHANYVAAYWSPNLLKVSTIGAHIFYRWTGGWGQPGAFGGRYEGSELEGMQIAALDRLTNGQKTDLVTGDVAEAQTAPVDLAAGKPAEAIQVASAETHITTASEAAPKTDEIVKPEELDWQGRPKTKQASRIAAPARMF